MPTKTRTSIPIELFQVYLNDKIKSYGSKEALARKLGLSSRRVDEYLTGIRKDPRSKDRNITEITIHHADKIAIKLDDHLIDIDPSLYE